MVEEKNLLESGIQVHSINEEARKEKIGAAKPPISNMHYFFTRKPLVSARLVIASALLTGSDIKNPDELSRLIGIDPSGRKRAYKTIPSTLAKKIAARYPEGVTILDPFAGSGMIPFEALRLGLNAVAIDYNPVAYLILKATLEFPLKYGGLIDEKTGQTKLSSDVKNYAQSILKKLQQDFSDYYPSHNGNAVRAYIHSWVVKCPTCGKETPLISNWWLNKEKRIQLHCESKKGCLVYSIVTDSKNVEGNMKRGYATCLNCSAKITNDYIADEISRTDREKLLVVSLTNGSFELPSQNDIAALTKANDTLKLRMQVLSRFIPAEIMPDDQRNLPSKKYLTYWRRLFNPRQLLILSSLAKEIRETVDEISQVDPDYAKAIGLYLSFILSNHLNHNSRNTMWISARNQSISNSLFNRGIGIMWNHAEGNPFSACAGSLFTSIKSVVDGLTFATEELCKNRLANNKKPNVAVYQASALSWQSKEKFKFIITDPPYYDDVPYPELLEFFEVWHSRTIGDLFGIPPTPSTNEDLSVANIRNNKTFETRMLVAIKNISRILEEDGVLVIFYAHRSVDGWKYLLDALRKTGFKVTSTIALMTENKESVLAKGRLAIFHSLVLTARKRKEQRTINLIDLEDEIRSKIAERYCDLEKIYGHDRMNLMLAASGIVIEAITSYSEIKSFTNNTADYALEMGQRFLIEAFAKRTLNIANADPKTMIYTWFRHSLNDSIEFSVFNQTLKAIGVNEENIADIYRQDNSGDTKSVRLLDFSARGTLEIDGMEPLVAQSVIDSVHIALRAYIRGGVTLARASVIDSPYGSKAVLNIVSALADLYIQRNDYKEGEICKRFLEEWRNVYGGEQKTFK
jgi:putative DNA methylase